MKHFFTLVTLAALLISIQACSKEKRLERMIYTNDGNWNITTMTYTLVATDENNTVVTLAATLENAGTFDFEKDGSGSYNFTIDGVNHAQSFGWSNSDESVSITRISQNIDFTTGDIEQLAIAFGGEKTDRDQISLSGTETFQATSGSSITQSVLTLDMILDKK